MRVNIGYSCDLEDVQEELASFLERAGLKRCGRQHRESRNGDAS